MKRALPALLVLALSLPAASAASSNPLVADLAWDRAVGVGNVAIGGEAFALHVVRNAALTAPESALLLLDADHVALRGDGHESKVVRRGGSVRTDTEVQTWHEEIDGARIRLVEARSDIQLMVAPLADRPVPRLQVSAPELTAVGTPSFTENFFEQVNNLTADDLQRSASHEGPALSMAADATGGSSIIEGDFTLYLWGIDIADASQPEKAYSSGTTYSNDVGTNPVTNEPAASDKHEQLLTLEVTKGRLTFSVPGRSLRLFSDPATSQLTSEGSWDLVGARGSVSLAGKSNDVRGSDLRLGGAFDVRFDARDGIRSSWHGSASEASAAGTPLAAGQIRTTAAHAGVTWWPLVLGLSLLGAGGAGFTGARAYRSRRSTTAAAAAISVPVEDVRDEALVAENIGLLQEGKAAQVIENLEPSFDASVPAAPVRAYLLSLAHLREGHNEDGVRWILRAIEFFPDFAQELRVNDAFAPVRDDARLRKFVEQEGVTGYV